MYTILTFSQNALLKVPLSLTSKKNQFLKRLLQEALILQFFMLTNVVY